MRALRALGAVGFVYFLASGVTNAFQKGFRIAALAAVMVRVQPGSVSYSPKLPLMGILIPRDAWEGGEGSEREAEDMLIFEMVAALPLLFLFTVNMRVCAHGAALTEKCRQIPAFVNQIPSAEPIEPWMQHGV
ncbi:hypothetical protein AK812_SmicGene10839 [Symbiodinium microadriaticum]|uniref:Uncharacterized protein n=1 Tax=Symbiodinium microadriaticum TaxID=2951 RepID=A0A1Q9EEP8_SYMMI|nr:hypothetical protein AK812_SmicGene10839 [Symbiodinium microadriaticum]